jgi:hypothetical protein
MLKKIILVLSLCISSSVWANEFEVSTGVGHQYGGVIGVQLSNKTELSNYYLSLGYAGAAIGFETTLEKNSKHSYGVVAGIEAISKAEEGFGFITYNYHLNGFSGDGLVIGAGVGITKGSGVFGEPEPDASAAITVNLGYKF